MLLEIKEQGEEERNDRNAQLEAKSFFPGFLNYVLERSLVINNQSSGPSKQSGIWCYLRFVHNLLCFNWDLV
jgi:hypothetical protein